MLGHLAEGGRTLAASRGHRPAVGSGRGALPGLPRVGFRGPPAEPGVRLSTHRALHVSFPLVSR